MRALVCTNKYNALDAPTPPSAVRRPRVRRIENPYAGCVPVKKDSRFLPEAWTRIGEYPLRQQRARAGHRRLFARARIQGLALLRQGALQAGAGRITAPTIIPTRSSASTSWSCSPTRRRRSRATRAPICARRPCSTSASASPRRTGTATRSTTPRPGSSAPRPSITGREREPHVREIFAKLGDIYFDETEYFRAIEVYKRHAREVALPPRQSQAAGSHRHGLRASARLRPCARGARGAGAQLHEGHRVVQAQPRQQAEAIQRRRIWPSWRSSSAAVNHHKAAQDLKKLAAGRRSARLRSCSTAFSVSTSWPPRPTRSIWSNIPNSQEHIRVFVFIRGDALLLGTLSSTPPRRTRRSATRRLDNKYAEDSAFNAVKSYEMALASSTQQGRSSRRCRRWARRRCRWCRWPMPETVGKLQKAYDAFIAARAELGPRADDDVQGGGNSDCAICTGTTRARAWSRSSTKYCKDDIGANAGSAILVTYTIEKNLDKIEEWANQLEGGQLRLRARGAEERRRARQAVARRQVPEGRCSSSPTRSTRRRRASTCRSSTRDPHGEDADKALNNAAVAYENVKRFAAATQAVRAHRQRLPDLASSSTTRSSALRSAIRRRSSSTRPR